MITQFTCVCGANKPEDAKYYDGAVGYEAIICKKCGRMYDHAGEHPADEFSCHFVGITMEQAAEKAAFITKAVSNYQKLVDIMQLTAGNLRDIAAHRGGGHSEYKAIIQLADRLENAIPLPPNITREEGTDTTEVYSIE